MQEIGHGIAAIFRSIPGWIDDAVRCRGEAVIGKALEHIANIDDKGMFRWVYCYPLSVLAFYLKSRFFRP